MGRLRIASLSSGELRRRLQNNDLVVSMPPFVVRFRSNVPSLTSDFLMLYGGYELADVNDFADFHVEIRYVPNLKRLFDPEIRFYFDGTPSFSVLPAQQSFPTLEWGLNWCVAAHSHHYLVVHAAVLERNGFALIMPAPPGSGKSTLCAALMMNGWRLMSDELTLYDRNTGRIYGHPRPVSLKNRSIDVISSAFPDSVMTTPVMTESKGMVALLKPPESAVVSATVPAKPRWLVLPKYEQGTEARFERQGSARTFALIAEQSFNYDLLGLDGFNAVGSLVDQCICAKFTYSDLDEAMSLFQNIEAHLHEVASATP